MNQEIQGGGGGTTLILVVQTMRFLVMLRMARLFVFRE